MNNDAVNIEPGDLVWVPSEVTLYKFEDYETPGPADWVKTEHPVNVLVSEVFENSVMVHYNGTPWEVKKRDVYPTKENTK